MALLLAIVQEALSLIGLALMVPAGGACGTDATATERGAAERGADATAAERGKLFERNAAASSSDYQPARREGLWVDASSSTAIPDNHPSGGIGTE